MSNTLVSTDSTPECNRLLRSPSLPLEPHSPKTPGPSSLSVGTSEVVSDQSSSSNRSSISEDSQRLVPFSSEELARMKLQVKADKQRQLQQYVGEETSLVQNMFEVSQDSRSKALVHLAHVLDHEDLKKCAREFRNTPFHKRDPIAVAVFRYRKQQHRLLWKSVASIIDDHHFAPAPAQVSAMRLFMPGCQTPHAPDDLDFRRFQRSQQTVEKLSSSGRYFLEPTEDNMRPTPTVSL
eukprot:Hpha_TRINITY_DN14484_c0_g1::TRINITY_DN14484_c0_g1_i3::g.158031::m.158031